MSDRLSWLRVVGGGCLVNVAATGLLVGLVASFSGFTIDRIVIPFLVGAMISLGASFALLRRADNPFTPLRKVVLASAGVFLGSIFAVLGLTAILLLSTYGS